MLKLATVLLIIGGLNWGLIGFFGFDLVAAVFGGQGAALSRIIYAIVGVAAVYEIVAFRRVVRGSEVPAKPEHREPRSKRAA